jgi:bifunctional non-homologous end joining protein LigD
VLVDWSQNDDHKTTVNVYSLRAKERPTVSTPVTWEEVEQCLKKRDANSLVFTSDEVLKRVAKRGDLFEPVLELKQKLPPLESLQSLDLDDTAAVSTAPTKARKSAKKKSAKKKTRTS